MSTVDPSQATRRVELRYPGHSELRAGAEGSQVALALDERRGPVGVRGRVKDAALFRDAFMTALEVLGSDLRYKRRDRAAYLAYLAKKGKKATKEIWEAQKAFLEQELGDEQKPTAVLEPLLTVHPDEVSFEVFSRDESSYARLALSNDLFAERQAAHGTTSVDLSPAFVDGLDRLRSWQPVTFDASSAAAPGQTPEARTLDVPYKWIRGFLQVQSAATLSAAQCEIAPIDLYNVLFALRTRKAKTSPRALRFELVPGAPPRLVLEPWEILLEGHGPAYRGPAPRVVRTFGRQRLLALARLLPHVKSASVRLLGAGLPVFWVLDLGAGRGSLTLGLTGWSESGWSSAAAFDMLMPPAGARATADRIDRLLQERGPQPQAELAKAIGGTPADLRAGLQLLTLRGRAIFDLAREVYRPRALFAEPVDEAAIRYGDEREQRAHRLLGDEGEGTGEVKITKLHEIAGEGIEIHGEVTDREARRSYSPSFTLDNEGRVSSATCGCPPFRRAGLREGPCEHLIALRLAYGRQRAREEALRNTPEGRKLIRAETRTYVRRDATGAEVVYRVSLDDRTVAVQWGARAVEPRRQKLWYDTDADAQAAYFARLEELSKQGFIDADAAVG